MTTADDVINKFNCFIGFSEANGKFKQIIDTYNNIKPLPQGYKLQYSDEWCCGGLSAMFFMSNAIDLVHGGECSCLRLVNLSKANGTWKGRTTPKKGDVVLYTWNGSTPQHIGLVRSVSNASINVIECNISETVGTRNINYSDSKIYGFMRPNYSTKEETPDEIPSQIIIDIIDGKYGNGEARKKKIEAIGYNYTTVQSAVNDYLKKKSNALTLDEVANDVINGKYGNGNTRRKKIEALGLNYREVQERVNQILQGN